MEVELSTSCIIKIAVVTIIALGAIVIAISGILGIRWNTALLGYIAILVISTTLAIILTGIEVRKTRR